MSVMIALPRSCGSSSPNARPASVSYGMVWPVSGVVRSMTIRVMRACTGGTQASSARVTATVIDADRPRSECSDMIEPSTLSDFPISRCSVQVRRPPRRYTPRRAEPACSTKPLVVALPVTVATMVIVVVIVAVVVTPLTTELRRRLRCVGGRGHTSRKSQRDHAVELALGVLAQHEPVLDHVADRMSHLAPIALERGIALLDRGAWIAGGEAIGPGPGERNELAGTLAA